MTETPNTNKPYEIRFGLYYEKKEPVYAPSLDKALRVCKKRLFTHRDFCITIFKQKEEVFRIAQYGTRLSFKSPQRKIYFKYDFQKRRAMGPMEIKPYSNNWE